jgi:hypothetical protein
VRRHEKDAVSLVAGLLFLVVAAVQIVASSTDTDLNPRWILPADLVLLGVLGLRGAVRYPRRGAGEPAAAEAPTADESVGMDDTAILEVPVTVEADEASPQR